MAGKQLFIAGDSTASTYSQDRTPMTGWGQVIGDYLFGVTVRNFAFSGRSSKSFIEEGRLQKMEQYFKQGDLLLIQFGHNDAKQDERFTTPFSTFKQYLKEYISSARTNGVTPILLTPVQRRSFTEDGRFVETHGDYPVAIRELAQSEKVAMIDVTKESKVLFENIGPKELKTLFMWLPPRNHSNYEDGIQDDTHFSELGARTISKLIVRNLQSQKLL
ncbi:rhamnogalacturonan acetylesterase [Alkalihalobacillus sp. LMS39]|uniref:rhamnogalacturonan acetylesterase n=1 Tax=Alkalihalobacillus sp. LMS39 TaxID=2924032 RepID=UPI001FB271FE|nr:rhamnogalacturonan acetylesterase [Alkalihalobacillus sp. LMS39]UOE93057.1 rhamnogalacturonan acetylesterase [Alkalihalobacillus sp. LMS39]